MARSADVCHPEIRCRCRITRICLSRSPAVCLIPRFVVLKALTRRHRDPDHCVMLYMHGNAGNRVQGHRKHLARHVSSGPLNMNFVTIDYRYVGLPLINATDPPLILACLLFKRVWRFFRRQSQRRRFASRCSDHLGLANARYAGVPNEHRLAS